jgi:hypothetical protein
VRDYPKGNRDPSSHRTREQIHEMDSGYNHTPTNIKKRSERNQARRIMTKKVGAEAIKGKDVDHKKMVKDGGTNAPGNLRIQTPHKNRGWMRDQ